MATFTLMREKEIRSGVPVPQVSEDDVDSQYSGGLRSWRDPRDADSASDAGAPPSGLVSEQAGYALRRNRCVGQSATHACAPWAGCGVSAWPLAHQPLRRSCAPPPAPCSSD